jgi:predicted nucleic acid-binding protein
MTTADTSLVVAAFASWHEAHERARSALAPVRRVPAHVLLETYSLLTRLPPPHRAPASVVHDFLRQRFPEAPLGVSPRAYPGVVAAMAESGLTGGAVYDALIAAVARRAGATLLTRDQRAVAAYERVGVTYQVIA